MFKPAAIVALMLATAANVSAQEKSTLDETSRKILQLKEELCVQLGGDAAGTAIALKSGVSESNVVAYTLTDTALIKIPLNDPLRQLHARVTKLVYKRKLNEGDAKRIVYEECKAGKLFSFALVVK